MLNYLPPEDSGRRRNPPAPPRPRRDPAITHHMLGLGHVIYVSTTASRRRVDDAAGQADVRRADARTARRAACGRGDYWMNLTVGQPLEIPPQVRLAGAPDLLDDANTSDPRRAGHRQGPGTGGDRPTVYRSRPLAKPGMYTLSLGNGTVPIAVNVPPDEADVRTIGNDRSARRLGSIDDDPAWRRAPRRAPRPGNGNDLGWIVLVAVFVLLAAECLMAMRSGTLAGEMSGRPACG